MSQSSVHVPLRHLLMGALTIFVVLLLVACGTNTNATTTTASNSNIPATSSATSAPTNPPATQACGTVHTMRLLIVPADVSHAQSIEDCFWQAFQTCHPATLIYAQNSLDSGVIHNFSLRSVNGTCVITDGVQHFVAPHPPQAATSYTCTGLTRQADGLHFRACGEASDVVVPSISAQ